MSITLDRFDEVIGGATNDETAELCMRLFEELAERAGNVSRLALRSDDRDAINEAAIFVATILDLFPMFPNSDRVTESRRYVSGCQRKLKEAIEQRGQEGNDGPRFVYVESSPAVRRLEKARREQERREAAELVEAVDFSKESILAAFRDAVLSSDGDVQAKDVALALCPDATESDTPGRQQVINRVGAVIRRLAADGAVVMTASGDGRRRPHRWALLEGSDDVA